MTRGRKDLQSSATIAPRFGGSTGGRGLRRSTCYGGQAETAWPHWPRRRVGNGVWTRARGVWESSSFCMQGLRILPVCRGYPWGGSHDRPPSRWRSVPGARSSKSAGQSRKHSIEASSRSQRSGRTVPWISQFRCV